jgi:hypothetical protein
MPKPTAGKSCTFKYVLLSLVAVVSYCCELMSTVVDDLLPLRHLVLGAFLLFVLGQQPGLGVRLVGRHFGESSSYLRRAIQQPIHGRVVCRGR